MTTDHLLGLVGRALPAEPATGRQPTTHDAQALDTLRVAIMLVRRFGEDSTH